MLLQSWPRGRTGPGPGHGAACSPGPPGALRRFQVSCLLLPAAPLALSPLLYGREHPSCTGSCLSSCVPCPLPSLTTSSSGWVPGLSVWAARGHPSCGAYWTSQLSGMTLGVMCRGDTRPLCGEAP